MLLALVMALSLCVPAFAADGFEAEAPAAKEEAPAAPVAEAPGAAEEPDMPAEAAVEPEAAADDEPDTAAAKKARSRWKATRARSMRSHNMTTPSIETWAIPGKWACSPRRRSIFG